MADTRLILTADDSYEDQLTAAIEASPYPPEHKGKICISVSAEQADGSYNRMFECSIHLTREQAAELRDWLANSLLL